jgi:hypothetical protein
MSEKKINLENILMASNIENNFSFFNRIFDYDNLSKKDNLDKKDIIDVDEKNNIFQWVRLFEIIISIMKNDSTYFYNIFSFYNNITFSKLKTDFYNKVKSNVNLMTDIKNNLKKDLILNFISNGNWVESQKIEKIVYDYYFNLFNKKEFFEIVDELTTIQIHNKKNIYILKDSSLKYLDLDYYYSPVTKSKAELYINDFKKDKPVSDCYLPMYNKEIIIIIFLREFNNLLLYLNFIITVILNLLIYLSNFIIKLLEIFY